MLASVGLGLRGHAGPASCVGAGDRLLTTAWRSSSADAGLADLEAMSAARQRPQSQLQLLFHVWNACPLPDAVKFFARPRLSLRLACPAASQGRCVR